MKIESLQQLSKLIALCRKQGVDVIKVDGIELVLGQAPVTAKRSVRTLSAKETAQIETSGLSDEDLLFYSATGQIAEQQ